MQCRNRIAAWLNRNTRMMNTWRKQVGVHQCPQKTKGNTWVLPRGPRFELAGFPAVAGSWTSEGFLCLIYTMQIVRKTLLTKTQHKMASYRDTFSLVPGTHWERRTDGCCWWKHFPVTTVFRIFLMAKHLPALSSSLGERQFIFCLSLSRCWSAPMFFL